MSRNDKPLQLWDALCAHDPATAIARLQSPLNGADPGLLLAAEAQDGEKLPSDRFLIFAICDTLSHRSLLHSFTSGHSRKELTLLPKGKFQRALHKRLGDMRGQKIAATNLVHPYIYLKGDQSQVLLNRRHDDIRNAVLAIVNKWRADHGKLAIKDLFGDRRICGQDAVNALRAILFDGFELRGTAPGRPASHTDVVDHRGWIKRPDTLGGTPLRFVHVAGDLRSKVLEQIAKAAFDPDSNIQIINGYSKDMRGGLTALATELFDSKRRTEYCSQPMCYIPLHGRAGKDIVKGERFSEILREIHAFFMKNLEKINEIGPSDPVSSTKVLRDQNADLPPLTQDESLRLIDEIRDAMAIVPAILVFDGYRAARYIGAGTSYPLHNLVAAIAEDRLFDIVERLFLPRTPTKKGQAPDMEMLSRNRCIILSDQALYRSNSEPAHPHPFLHLVNGISFEIERPDAAAIPDIIHTFGNQSPKQIEEIEFSFEQGVKQSIQELEVQAAAHRVQLLDLAGSWKGSNPNRPELPQSESVYGVLSSLIMLGVRRLTDASRNAGEGNLLRLLISRDLKDALGAGGRKADGIDREMFKLFLHLLAIAPGGLRPKTLARVAEHYFECVKPEEQTPSPDEINAQIGRFLKTCNGIVGLCRADSLEKLTGRNLPLIWLKRFSYPVHEIPAERAIMFAFEEARQHFITDARRVDDGRDVAILHALLAEEAYEQFTHLARFDDLQADQSLHRNARLLSALYHGGASLHDHHLTIDLKVSRLGAFLPVDTAARWIKIYGFMYRKNLDRAPINEMVRLFDAGQTKLDILQLLASPQLVYEQVATTSGWPLPTLPDTHKPPDGVPREAVTPIFRRFEFDIRQAVEAVGQPVEFQWQATEDPTDPRAEKLTHEIAVEQLAGSDGAPGYYKTLLVKLGNLHAAGNLTEHVGKIADFAHREVMGDDPGALFLDELTRNIVREVVPPLIALNQSSKDQYRYKDIIDYLALIGEAAGVAADHLDAPDQTNFETGDGAEMLSGFCIAFGAYHLADKLRQARFWISPLAQNDVISGRAGRGFLRVCLKLEGFRKDQLGSDTSTTPDNGLFWHRAQHVSNDLARHLSRYPRERAGMLILDAAMARASLPKRGHSEPDRAEHYLEMARECLAQAEVLILKMGMHNRLRQRFALERCKVMAASAQFCVGQDAEKTRKNYLAIARSDIVSLTKLARTRNKVWETLARFQSEKLDTLEASWKAR